MQAEGLATMNWVPAVGVRAVPGFKHCSARVANAPPSLWGGYKGTVSSLAFARHILIFFCASPWSS